MTITKINTLFTVVFMTCIFASCQDEKQNIDANTKPLSKDRAESIIKEYNLKEGSVSFTQNTDKQTSKTDKGKEGGSLSITEAEFRSILQKEEDYQNSKEGQMTSQIGTFFKQHKIEPYSEQQIDSFFKKIDSEYGTQLYENFRKNRENITSSF